MLGFDIFIYIILGVIILFFLLGLKSQKGKAIGLVDGKLAPSGFKPNCAASESCEIAKHQVEPLKGNLEQAKAAIVASGGTITSETDSYISATYMSKLFKFVDDVELRDAGKGAVHIRSASRVGYSDRGMNHKRVEQIRAAI